MGQQLPKPTTEEVIDAIANLLPDKHFQYAPFIIGGRVLEFYNLRKTNDVDLILHEADWNNLHETKTYPKIYPPDDKTNKWIDFRGNIGGVDVFLSIANENYSTLQKQCIPATIRTTQKRNSFIISSLKVVLEMKTFITNDKTTGKDIKNKAKQDIQLIVSYLR
jgi:hypothetical protein